ncbi:response regulator receiver modulated metal dependent phosphohydrolase [Chloroherpeton thalassium ATCC 35110]|uniref:Response regulator receiver modulated metal dependent phosphohydrolase n=1 Tax=Chloroherpeton thalassium (strain ATCC 35110 / GB-78) TaxID=517418 RepID=B3QXR2_CHLT3|nr:HD domain-containing phosphohydrolase [Chloroherpeton thalassium]ACF14977.1 response regulator receiver modulated metal dependent phosphohydrolase [Chloroherpeton thalassium ATCC 35110]
MNSSEKKAAEILIVDDQEIILRLLEETLKSEGYAVLMASNGVEALEAVEKKKPDLIITDMLMPKLNGCDMVSKLKESADTRLIPTIMLTGLFDFEHKVRALEIGVDDFLGKPFNRIELITKVRALLKTKSYIDQLEDAETVIFSLALAIEGRDPYTNGHCQRLSEYGAKLAKKIGMDDLMIDAVRKGGVIHDIGKISVPDAILLKPGKLTEAEYEIMKTHPEVGENICKPMKSLTPVLPIIRWHQERWDGSGYPDKLSGTAIPLPARLIAIVDLYDALITVRPYKKAFSLQESIEIMSKETQENKWDPNLMKVFQEMLIANEFEKTLSEINSIKYEHA